MLAVSLPGDCFDFFDRMLGSLLNCWCNFARLLLLLSGDVELNPGPDTQILAAVLSTVKRIEQGQTAILNEIKQLSERQESTESALNQLSTRVTSIETELATLRSAPTGVAPSEMLTAEVSSQLSRIVSRCDDAENRLRRSNLLFLGIDDEVNETWRVSEKKILDFCSLKLDITLCSGDIERAHRLGQFTGDKSRPIIVKLLRFKDKETILSAGHKLRGTRFAIREDFCPAVRQARANLLKFAKEKGSAFKLRFDKLHIDKHVYTYDNTSDSVRLFNPVR